MASDEQRKIMLERAATFATLRLPPDSVNDIVRDVVWRSRHMLDPLRDFPYLRWGYRKGKAEGLVKGQAKGKAEGKAESLLALLAGRGLRVSPAVRKKILSCTDQAQLDRWFHAALTAKSAAEVLGAN